jgi:hypothetical protein
MADSQGAISLHTPVIEELVDGDALLELIGLVFTVVAFRNKLWRR